MANAFLDTVWVIDTAFTTGSPGSDLSGEVIPAGALDTQKMHIDTIRWVGAGAADATAEIADGAGNIVWESQVEIAAASDKFSTESRAALCMTGLRVPTLTDGVLYLYHTVTKER